MKKLLLAIIFTALIGSVAGIVYENGSTPECPEGEMCIMNKATPTSSASGTAAAGPNGTEYSSKLETISSSCATGNMSDRVYNRSFSTLESNPPQHRTSFEGVIITSNPCQTVDHDLTKVDNSTFIMDITTNSSGGLCTQCVGMVKYEASFTNHGERYDLEVRHNGNEIRVLEFPEPADESEDHKLEKKNLFNRFFNWLNSIF